MFEHFEHTADLGLRIRGDDLDSLFAEAGAGLLSIIVENPGDVRATEAVPIRIEGADPGTLLFDWLAELLFIFDTRHLLLCAFEVRVGPSGLEATARGEPIDLQRHRLLHEIKAITYHGLRVERVGNAWEAEVIVDI